MFGGSTPGSFLVDVHETTVAQFRKYCDERGLPMPLQPPGHLPEWPVTGITREEARGYAKWAGKRLPTEVEWFLAACGKQSHPWGSGDPSGLGAGFPTHRGDVKWTPVPVGTRDEDTSPSGCRDMGGNVLEWINDSNMKEEADGRRWERGLACGWAFTAPANGPELWHGLILSPVDRHPWVGLRCVISLPLK